MISIELVTIESSETVKKFRVRYGGEHLSFQKVLGLLAAGDANMIGIMNSAITNTFEAVFWECVPITSTTLDTRPFEFVIVNAPRLTGVTVDPDSFADKFIAADPACKDHNSVIRFKNLGGDSTLVVPCPSPDKSSLGSMVHMAAFLRSAPKQQVENLWKLVGRTAAEALQDAGGQRRWLSTSGLGVYWLHVRIDSSPKYYNYQPYKQ